MGWLTAYGRRYPQAWAVVDEVRSRRGSDFPDWPEWCFVPLPGAMEAVVNGGGPAPEGHVELTFEATRIAALAPWRMTKGVYRFAPAVLEAVWGTPIEGGDVPSEALFRLPEWCAYVETPGKTLPLGDDGEERPIRGFFAHLNHYEGMDHPQFSVVLDVPAQQGREDALFPLHVGLHGPTLEECLVEDARRSASQHEANTGVTPYEPEEILSHLIALVGPPLSLTLYLCTSESIANLDPSGRERPGNPRPRPGGKKKGAKGRIRLFAAQAPSVWAVN